MVPYHEISIFFSNVAVHIADKRGSDILIKYFMSLSYLSDGLFEGCEEEEFMRFILSHVSILERLRLAEKEEKQKPFFEFAFYQIKNIQLELLTFFKSKKEHPDLNFDFKPVIYPYLFSPIFYQLIITPSETGSAYIDEVRNLYGLISSLGYECVTSQRGCLLITNEPEALVSKINDTYEKFFHVSKVRI